MSTERDFAGYVRALLDACADAEPAAFARLVEVVGQRRARMTLDDETLLVHVAGGTVQVGASAADAAADGCGATDRQTVLDLLDGYVEVHEAIERGRLHILGEAQDVERMLIAIEILLDVAVRAPALQALARDFRRAPRTLARCVARRAPPPDVDDPRASVALRDFLRRHDLLP